MASASPVAARPPVQARAAAEAGVDVAVARSPDRAAAMPINCPRPVGRVRSRPWRIAVPGSSGDPAGPAGCPTSTTSQVRIRSTGYAEANGVEPVQHRETPSTVEAMYQYIPAYPGIPADPDDGRRDLRGNLRGHAQPIRPLGPDHHGQLLADVQIKEGKSTLTAEPMAESQATPSPVTDPSFSITVTSPVRSTHRTTSPSPGADRFRRHYRGRNRQRRRNRPRRHRAGGNYNGLEQQGGGVDHCGGNRHDQRHSHRRVHRAGRPPFKRNGDGRPGGRQGAVRTGAEASRPASAHHPLWADIPFPHPYSPVAGGF